MDLGEHHCRDRAFEHQGTASESTLELGTIYYAGAGAIVQRRRKTQTPWQVYLWEEQIDSTLFSPLN
jgi:hypothetical protein